MRLASAVSALPATGADPPRLQPPPAGEVLDGQNKYKCPKQGKGVRAVKRMTVDAAPNVLMIQLKRFEFSFSGHKISKKVGWAAPRLVLCVLLLLLLLLLQGWPCRCGRCMFIGFAAKMPCSPAQRVHARCPRACWLLVRAILCLTLPLC